jgi:hypothetical protein
MVNAIRPRCADAGVVEDSSEQHTLTGCKLLLKGRRWKVKNEKAVSKVRCHVVA